jgi:hypothetical protein
MLGEIWANTEGASHSDTEIRYSLVKLLKDTLLLRRLRKRTTQIQCKSIRSFNVTI